MKFFATILSVTFAVFFFSCSNDSSNNEVKDDFSYLSVNDNGEIHKIGNNSGKITSYSQFDVFAKPINLSTVTSNSDKIFLIEYYQGVTKLLIFDRKTKTTISKKLELPEEIIGIEPTITSLTWDESKKTLYGIILDNLFSFSSDNTCYFIKINPNNFEITYEGLTFKQSVSLITILNKDKLYSFNHKVTPIEIDLNNNTTKTALFNNSNISITRPCIYDNNTAFCLKVDNDNSNTTITKLNLNDNSYEDLLVKEPFGIFQNKGNGFIDKTNNQYIFNTSTVNIQHCILKYNISTNKYTILKLISNSTINDNILIIDKIDN